MRTEPSCLCGNPLPPRHRKYCADCSPMASLLWKRAQRRLNKGTPYWLDSWLKVAGSEEAGRAAYRDYMRHYMRRYRAQAKSRYRTVTATSVPKQRRINGVRGTAEEARAQ